MLERTPIFRSTPYISCQFQYNLPLLLALCGNVYSPPLPQVVNGGYPLCVKFTLVESFNIMLFFDLVLFSFSKQIKLNSKVDEQIQIL